MVGILLAAGFSRRFGSADKLLQCLPDGRSIAQVAAENLIQAIPHSIAVVRAENQTLATQLKQSGLKVIFCQTTDLEMADSLTTAIRHVAEMESASEGVVIALADMPYILPDTIRSVAEQVRNGAAIVMPSYQGQRGHPVGFSAKFYSELAQLTGDEGARSVIKRHTNEVQTFETDDAGVLVDIDTPADLKT